MIEDLKPQCFLGEGSCIPRSP